MKITILTYGSRGDVQPFLPLSLRLAEEGHSVKLAAPSRFESFVEEQGIGFVPLRGDPEDLSRRLNEAGHNFVRLLQELKNIPDIHIQTFPMFTPIGDYPNITMSHRMSPSLNRFTHEFRRR